MDKHGWIYIFNNEERDGDGVFKVGYTSDVKLRLSQLNSETGSYGKFEQIAKFFVTDMEAAERECHEELEDYRKQDNREFFQGNQKEIVNIVKNIISNYKPVDEFPDTHIPIGAAPSEPSATDSIPVDIIMSFWEVIKILFIVFAVLFLFVSAIDLFEL